MVDKEFSTVAERKIQQLGCELTEELSLPHLTARSFFICCSQLLCR